MANIEKLIPHLIEWEAGVKGNMSNRELFEKAKKTGFANDPNDLGGATMIGITFATYGIYCRRKGLKEPTLSMLKNISYDQWLDILKTMFWDIWKADAIINQSIANFLVDFFWNSGFNGIKVPQRVMGLKDDGIVGAKTLQAVNLGNQEELFFKLVEGRKCYIENIIKKRPANAKFRNGWINRINSFKFNK